MDSNSTKDRNEQQENQISSSTIPLQLDKSETLTDPNQSACLAYNPNQIPQGEVYLIEKKKKRKFTSEEDQKLRDLVHTHGQKQWDLIARSLGADRTARQCRDRWKHYLSPTVSQREWTLEEDRMLLKYIQTYGAQWAALVKFFPGRTDINLKNHWNKLQRKSKKLALINPNIHVPKLPLTPEPLQLLAAQIPNFHIASGLNQPPPDQGDAAQAPNGLSFPLLSQMHVDNMEKPKTDLNGNLVESVRMPYDDNDGTGAHPNQ